MIPGKTYIVVIASVDIPQRLGLACFFWVSTRLHHLLVMESLGVLVTIALADSSDWRDTDKTTKKTQKFGCLTLFILSFVVENSI